ncbi:MAG TPA: hypothetical protein QF353_00050 [Gammaproteobacteria bacterium]|nr:hypothetical protein [Gammaproteobacteria bacterium]
MLHYLLISSLILFIHSFYKNFGYIIHLSPAQASTYLNFNPVPLPEISPGDLVVKKGHCFMAAPLNTGESDLAKKRQ